MQPLPVGLWNRLCYSCRGNWRVVCRRQRVVTGAVEAPRVLLRDVKGHEQEGGDGKKMIFLKNTINSIAVWILQILVWLFWCLCQQEISVAVNWIPQTFIGIVEVSVSAVHWPQESQCWCIILAALNRLGTCGWGAETLGALLWFPRPIKFPTCVSGKMSKLHLGRGVYRVLAGVPCATIPLVLEAQLSRWKGRGSDFNYRLIWNARKEPSILCGNKYDLI